MSTQNRLTMSEIRERVIASGSHFFDRKTMRFFGETMRNYGAGEVLPDGCQVFRKSGSRAGYKAYKFNPVTAGVSSYVESV